MTKAATQLSEVITTATGDVEKKSFGNVVATIKADSLVGQGTDHERQRATAGAHRRRAGHPGHGQTGASSSIRIRGASSLSLTNEPLIIVDGIRFDNSPASSNFSSIRVNRFGTFNPDEIESIDIIKGPSAAALYGTAAANGVIVIRTKRGSVGARSGPCSPKAGRFAAGGVHVELPGLGTNLNAAGPAGRRIPSSARCSQRRARPACSTRSPRTTRGPRARPIRSRRSRDTSAGLQVSGGSDQLRYFVSGEHQNEVGPYTMPDFEINRITQSCAASGRSIARSTRTSSR